MNYDELAFFNQQLAVMLRDGIPLEGAVRELCAGMKDKAFRQEMEQMQVDLSRGVPLAEALSRRRLPELYIRMVQLGARGNDLPGALTLVADHYHRVNALWTRLKGLLVYPVIVTAAALGLTILLSILLSRCSSLLAGMGGPFVTLRAAIWIPPTVLALLLIAGLVALSLPGLRARLRWWLPAFREASLAQLSSAVALMLRTGTPLPDALALAQGLESNSPAALALGQWRYHLAQGEGKPGQWPNRIGPFPPLFLWLVQNSGEDLAGGFQKASDLYESRASHRIELALYGALPVSILLIGQLLFWEIAPLMKAFTTFANMMGGMD
jgi:type IV pilus assembly protein PilC